MEQVIWGALGMIAGALLGVLFTATSGAVAPLSRLLFCVGGLLGGILGRAWWLGREISRREETIMAEFPVVAELLALAVTAGEGPIGAIERVCRLTGGELGRELSGRLAAARAGLPLVEALRRLEERNSIEALSRFVDGIVVATERGTPLAEVLRAQAADVREAGKRRLLEASGRKEIAMMAPVKMHPEPLRASMASSRAPGAQIRPMPLPQRLSALGSALDSASSAEGDESVCAT